MRAASAILTSVVALAATSADAIAARGCRGVSDSERPILARPSNGEVVSAFGPKFHPVLKYVRFHSGVDYAVQVGDPVLAAAAGRVVAAGRESGYGKRVIVRHTNDLETTYAHLSRILVRKGRCVDAGAMIGRTGTTGGGSHLHFEVRQSGRYVNPAMIVGVAR